MVICPPSHCARRPPEERGSKPPVDTSSPDAFGMTGPYWVSVAAVDAKGHESLFAYPELRCEDGDSAQEHCDPPADANDITTQK